LENDMTKWYVKLITAEDEGASMVEYALLVVLIAIVAFAAVQFAGDEVSNVFTEIANGLQDAS